MAIEKFRFVSPGIQVSEIDDSIIPTPFPATGPVVIGNTSRGPIMQPVQVSSVAELERVFGSTSNGKTGADDVWRSGAPTSPTLATYAARAYLQNASPITVIRLGGVEHNSSIGHEAGTEPGWKTDGVYNIFGVSGSTASLLANIYASEDVIFELEDGESGSVTGGHFKLIISNSAGETSKTVSLQYSSASFIRNQLNTNPSKYTDTSINYFLGETFENSTGSINNFTDVVIAYDTLKGNDFTTTNIIAAETGWVIDDLVDGSYNHLFKFVGLNNGSTLHKDIKISIENVRESKNKNITKYGTFDVVIRRLFETQTQSVIEKFADLNLDIDSENYIARRIGDTSRYWNTTSKRYEEEGTYANRSAFVRVVMSDNDIPSTALPHGFEIPQVASYDASDIDPAISSTIRPNISLFSEEISLTQAKSKRFGLVSDYIKNADIVDITSFSGKLDIDSGSQPAIFHTRHINLTGSSRLVYSSGSGPNTNDVLVNPTSNSGSILGFDMPIYGGTDGRNITLVESFVSADLLSDKDENNSAAYRSIKQALDIVSDADLMDMNLLCVPGLKEHSLTNYMLEICKLRGDTLALIDLTGDHKYYYETNGSTDSRPTSVKDVIEGLTERQIDNSYGAAYFPAVFVPSEGIYMPASIAALGAIGGTEGRAGLWFAPAGFNRGGLTVGNSGISVSRTALSLNSSDRDMLYTVNINPIATFPNEGVVIFGQKTLQSTQSALDRVNVRRLMNYLKKEISRAATRVIFEPNIEATWNSFKSIVEPFLLAVKNAYGLDDARVVLDSSTTTADLVDRNIMYCKIYVKPTKAIEYIGIDFVVSNSGAAFTE